MFNHEKKGNLIHRQSTMTHREETKWGLLFGGPQGGGSWVALGETPNYYDPRVWKPKGARWNMHLCTQTWTLQPTNYWVTVYDNLEAITVRFQAIAFPATIAEPTQTRALPPPCGSLTELSWHPGHRRAYEADPTKSQLQHLDRRRSDHQPECWRAQEATCGHLDVQSRS